MTDPAPSSQLPSDSDRPPGRPTSAGRPVAAVRSDGSWVPFGGSALIAGLLLSMIVLANLGNDDGDGPDVVPGPTQSSAR